MKNNKQFLQVPSINSSRSRFNLNYTHKTALNAGDLVPFHIQEVYPADTFETSCSNLIRLSSSFIKAPLDNLYLDTYYFFVPNRILWNNWVCMLGENKSGAWANPKDYFVPVCSHFSENEKQELNTLADYFGIPYNDNSKLFYNDLPFRAYAMIYNEWFRDQNNEPPVNIDVGDDVVGFINNNPFSVTNYHGRCAKVNKYHDYFTSCLPSPQKGSSVQINAFLGDLPVYASDEKIVSSSRNADLSVLAGDKTDVFDVAGSIPVAISRNHYDPISFYNMQNSDTGLNPASFKINNLFASSDGADASLFNVNELRFAFQLQKSLERDARGGTRYREWLLSHFNVNNRDARMQIPEFLASSSQRLNINQVLQTSASTEYSPQANVSAYSLTSGVNGFKKSFTEHGFIIGLCCIRQDHTYTQGVERFWLRRSHYDYYQPEFSNIGEQPVYKREIYDIADSNDTDLSIFGYNEAWADLRYKPDRCSSAMRPLPSSDAHFGDFWTFADFYNNSPSLNKDFLEETADYVSRTISVPHSLAPQFLVDFSIKQIATRELPVYSVPGLIDHH